MSPKNRVVISAGHHTAGERIEDSSLEELIFRTVSAAVESAGLTLNEVDAVVISGNDQLDGRIISCMVSTGPAGGVGKNVTTIASSPEHAFAYGYLRLLAGQGSNVLVVGWSKPSESLYPEHAELLSADPFFVRPIGLNQVIAAALKASQMVNADPSSAPDPTSTFLAWPLTAADYQGHSDGVCAIVMELRDESDERPGAWVRGVGWAMDRYDLGDREDAEVGGLDVAIRQASTLAGAEFGPINTLDAYTVGSVNERVLSARVASQLGNGGTTSFDSRDELNPDYAAGLFTIWRAAKRVLGSDAAGTSHSAAAVSTLGFAAQGSTVVLLSDCRGA